MRALTAVALILGLAGCVPYPGVLPEEERRTTIVQGPFPPLDAGAAELESLHFKVRSYGTGNAQRIADTAEAAYNRIMLDTNLYSFRPRGLYEIVVYGTSDEYHKKTGQPQWSGGVTVGNAIFTYESSRLPGTLAHEMTHLIFYEYMGAVNVNHRWVNEGLAVYEESQASGVQGGVDLFAAVRGNLRRQPIPIDQVIHMIPASEKEYTVNLWYAQSQSMIKFMIERGGRIGFSQFLQALKQGRGFSDAIAAGFPGGWRTLEDFEREWLRSEM